MGMTYAKERVKKKEEDNLKRSPTFYRKDKHLSKMTKTQREETDIYDIILSHLLDEGYAETPEAAEVIMVNMSEEWREGIVEGLGGSKNQDDYEEREKERKRVRDEHLGKYERGELPFQKQKKAEKAQEFLKKHPKKTK
jgi:hypothetical protein